MLASACCPLVLLSLSNLLEWPTRLVRFSDSCDRMLTVAHVHNPLHLAVCSQITNIRMVKEVMREATYLYAELVKVSSGRAHFICLKAKKDDGNMCCKLFVTAKVIYDAA